MHRIFTFSAYWCGQKGRSTQGKQQNPSSQCMYTEIQSQQFVKSIATCLYLCILCRWLNWNRRVLTFLPRINRVTLACISHPDLVTKTSSSFSLNLLLLPCWTWLTTKGTHGHWLMHGTGNDRNIESLFWMPQGSIWSLCLVRFWKKAESRVSESYVSGVRRLCIKRPGTKDALSVVCWSQPELPSPKLISR